MTRDTRTARMLFGLSFPEVVSYRTSFRCNEGPWLPAESAPSDPAFVGDWLQHLAETGTYIRAVRGAFLITRIGHNGDLQEWELDGQYAERGWTA